MQHMFLIRAVCGPGWIHVWTFQLFFFFLQCQWCGNNNWNQFFFDRITSCRAGVLEWQTLFCIFPVREKAKILYELICFWSVMTFFGFFLKKGGDDERHISSAHKLDPLLSRWFLSVDSLWCMALWGIFEDGLRLSQCLGGVMFKHMQPCKCICVFLLLESVIY